MKVWLLNSGSYSDYHVVGIFSSAEKALEAKKSRDDDEDGDPQEWEVDEMADWELGPVFHACINVTTGEIQSSSEDHISRHPSRCIADEFTGRGGGWHTVTSPISEDHARKVAVEKRQAWLREMEEKKLIKEALLTPPDTSRLLTYSIRRED